MTSLKNMPTQNSKIKDMTLNKSQNKKRNPANYRFSKTFDLFFQESF